MRFPAKIVWLVLWTVCVAEDCKEPPPRKETEILSGSWTEQTYQEGTQATYKCRPGYRTLGSIVMMCRGGKWVSLNPSRICRKKPCAHPGDTPFGSFHLAEGTQFEYGAKVVYTCDEGYQMVGEMNFRECDTNGWTNDIPICEVVKCLPVTEPENGKIFSDALEPDQEYTYGQVVQFECNSGYMLDGPKQIHCSAGGVWSAETPKCVEIFCKTPVILNGQAVLPKATYKANERVQYRCAAGFEYGQRGDTVCTKSGWTPAPTCIEIICDPPRIPNGVYRPELSKYRGQDKITYECKKGFFPEIRGTDATCTRDGWAPVPRCAWKPCSYPVIKHGRLSYAYRGYFPARVNQQFVYNCDPSFVPPSQRSWNYLTCTAEGWSPEEPCLRQCIFNYLENGHTPSPEEKYLQGETVRVHCYEGYSLRNDQNTMTCTESGWSPPPRCIRVKSCDRPVFEKARVKSDGTWFRLNDRLDYECVDGYENRDGRTTGSIVCGQDGWSDKAACYERECSIPEMDPYLNAYPRKDTYKVGDVLKFSCSPGRIMVGADSVQCYHFGWSPKLPTCEVRKVKSCALPPELPNGKGKEIHKEEYAHNEVVEYTCNPKFLMKGSRKIQCVDGEWTALPVCIEEERTCGNISDLDHGDVKPSVPPYHHGDSVEFSCREAFTMIGPRFIMCISGEWTQPPQCIATDELRKCKWPTSYSPEGKQAHMIEYDHSTNKTYQCRGKSGKIRHKHSVCINGEWDPKVDCNEEAKIQLCPPPPQVPNARDMTTTVKYQDGEKISILCKENYLIQDAEEIVCKNGSWQSIPQCIEIICDPPRIPNGVYRPELSKYRGQDKITYECKKGFFPEIRGTDATCTRDGWAPVPRCAWKPCSYPVIKHGRLSYSYRGYFPARVNQQFVYNCDQSFVPPSQRSWNYLTCTAEGWSPEEPCLRQCIFNYLENGHTPSPEEKYLQGETVRVRCYEGYSLQNDQNTMTCTESGWSPPPRCIRVKTCSKSNIRIENGFLSESTFTYPLNKQTEYKCKPGYVTADGKTSGLITCLQNGWSAQPVCIKSCDRPVLDKARVKSDGTWFRLNDRLDYECVDGYENRDGRTTGSIVCGQDGWSDKAACYERECSIPEMDPYLNAYPRKETFKVGDVLKFSCSQGRIMVGADSVQCYHFGWSPKFPTCEVSQGKCGPPPPIDNGEITSLLQSVYPPGTIVEYRCQLYYELRGNRNVVCQNGEWSQPPKCLEACLISEETMKKHHIQLRWKYDKKFYSKTEDTIEFMCQYGYRQLTPKHTFRTTCWEGKVVYPRCG
ncbi:complement factor H isoform X3 [Bubalus bubalis]|uniref:complement factor H isoform X3 n=1 Tax=Bubalus bubalis TaxID=89462 RepID=UPI001E1B7E13|nr:complement factor H isoform X3 [Bubalus bubalis]